MHAEKPGVVLLDLSSVELGIDKYVKDVILTVYGEKLLAQMFRLIVRRLRIKMSS